MTGETINTLCQFARSGYVPLEHAQDAGKAAVQATVSSYVDYYTNMACGWKFAREISKRKIIFPISMTGSDFWVYRAYLYLRNPVKYRSPVIEEAFALAQSPLEGVARTVRAAMMVKSATLQDIARATGFSVDVLDAFSALFWNIRDRWEDQAYIAQAVYPDTRIVTWKEDYFDEAGVGDILKRAGFESQDLDAVMHVAGLDTDAYERQVRANPESKDRVDGAFMSSAYTMAAIGLAHQDMKSLRNYKQLLIADKQGHAAESEDPVAGIGVSIQASLEQANRTHFAAVKAIAAYRDQEQEAEIVN